MASNKIKVYAFYENRKHSNYKLRKDIVTIVDEIQPSLKTRVPAVLEVEENGLAKGTTYKQKELP